VSEYHKSHMLVLALCGCLFAAFVCAFHHLTLPATTHRASRTKLSYLQLQPVSFAIPKTARAMAYTSMSNVPEDRVAKAEEVKTQVVRTLKTLASSH
jgi:hypothetical protein